MCIEANFAELPNGTMSAISIYRENVQTFQEKENDNDEDISDCIDNESE